MPTGVYKRTEEWKETRREAQIKFWQNPEYREHMSEMKKGSKNPMKIFKTAKKISKAQEGENNSNWKGDNVGYRGLHSWIRSKLGSPLVCEICGVSAHERKLSWANKNHSYKRNLKDWQGLCRSCHRKYDYIYN